MHNEEFKGDKKLPINSLLGALEKKLIASTVHKFPRWIEGYHLTLMTIIWSIGLIGFGYLARENRNWLWLSSCMLFLQWFTDCYDGALGRFRDTGIPKWGYYMDHLLDYLFLCALSVGYTFVFSEKNSVVIYLLLVIFSGFMVSSYLSFAATGEFKITYLGFGPTEMRLLFILLNTYIIFFDVTLLERYIRHIIPISLVVLVIVVFRTQKYIWNIDMQEKRSREKS
jgi:phosphatidylglycerophosphate synthase